MKTGRIILGLFLAIFLSSCSVAFDKNSPGALELVTQVKSLSVKTFFTKGWKVHFGDDQSYRELDFDDSSWTNIDLPYGNFSLKPKLTYYFWLRKYFVVNSSLEGQSFGLVTGKLPDASEVYVNGSLVGRSGSMPPFKYYGTRHIPRSYLIPEAILNYGGTNILSIRSYSKAGRVELPLIVSESDHQRMKDAMFDYLFNSVFPMVVTFLGIFIAFYFFILYFRDRRSYYLNIAAGLILIGIYYTDIYLEGFPLPFFLITKFQFISLYMGTLMFVFYLQGFLERHQNKVLMWVLTGVSTLASLAILWSPDYPTFDFLNGSVFFLFWVTPLLVYMLYLCISAAKLGNRYAKILAWGVGAVLIVGVRDILLASLGNTPRFWMSSWGMIAFIMTTFLSSANYTVDVYEEAQDKSEKLVHQSKSLRILLVRISNVGKKVADQVLELDHVITAAATAVAQMVDSNEKILLDLGDQVKLIEENNQSIRNMLESLGQMFADVDSQAKSVEKSTQIIQNLVDSIREVFQTTERATIISSQLKKVAKEGFNAVEDSARSMNAIKNSSEDVLEQVNDIFSIAEETNMLSMNAAIQSAHAGEYGRGFAVVAQEVRELANSSAETSTQIQEQIDNMMKRIREGSENFEKVEKGLTDISHGTDDTIAMINEIADFAQVQHNATNEVTESINVLVEATRNLKQKAEVQVGQGEHLQSSLNVFNSVANEIESTTKQQTQNGSEILKMVDEIRLFSNKNKEVVQELEEIIKEFQSDNFGTLEKSEC